MKNSPFENFERPGFTMLIQFSIVEYEWIKISVHKCFENVHFCCF